MVVAVVVAVFRMTDILTGVVMSLAQSPIPENVDITSYSTETTSSNFQMEMPSLSSSSIASERMATYLART